MKPKRFILFITTVILTVTVVVSLRTAIWQDAIVRFINQRLASGWTLSLDSIEGYVWGPIQVENLLLSSQDGNQFSVSDLEFSPSFFPLLFGKIGFKSIRVKDIYMKYSQGNRTGTSRLNLNQYIAPLTIDNLFMDGVLWIDTPESFYEYELAFHGRINSNESSLWLNLQQLQIDDPKAKNSFLANNTFMKITPTRFITAIEKGNINGQMMSGHIKYVESSFRHLQGNISFTDVNIPDKFLSGIPLQPQLSSLDLDFTFTSDFKLFKGNLAVSSPLGLDMGGEFVSEVFPNHIRIHKLELLSAKARLSGNGLFESNGRFNGSVQFQNFDFSQWVEIDSPSSISGLLLMDGQVVGEQIQEITLTAEIMDSSLYRGQNLSLSGSLTYNGEKLNIIDPLMLELGATNLEMNGWADFTNDSISLSCLMRNATPNIINNFWADTLKQGLASGSVMINGALSDPRYTVDLQVRDIRYKAFTVKGGTIRGKLKKPSALAEGECMVDFIGLEYDGNFIDHLSMDITFDLSKILVGEFLAKQGENYLQWNGSFDRIDKINIDRIQFLYNSHFLVNPAPFNITIRDSSVIFHPFEIHADDGLIAGEMRFGPQYQGHVKLSNIDADLIQLMFGDKIPPITGLAFGEIHAQAGDSPSLSCDVTLKNGELARQPFQDLVLSFIYQDSVLYIEDLSLFSDSTGFQIHATFPDNYPNSSSRIPLSVESSFTHLPLEWVMQFLPPWYHLEGIGSGTISYTGQPDKAKMNFALTIKDAAFDRIALGEVKGTGNYDGRRVNFTSFESRRGNGDSITGRAYLPLNLMYKHPGFGKINADDSLFVTLQAQTGNMDFLTNYIDDVDSVRGNIQLHLTVNGLFKQPVRNGEINISDGKIYTLLTRNSIKHVNGSATLSNNILVLDRFTAQMDEKEKTRKDNVHLSGSINLTSFFKPDYNLRIQGENVYVDLLTEDIQGRVNSDITLSGRDTIRFVGDVEIIDVEMFQEFTSTELGEILTEGSIITEYRINFPIIGKLTFINSQIEAVLSGEVSYSKLGNFPTDYAGELQLEEGKYYYYGDIFTITYGYLALEGKGFNPYMEIEANTVIKDEFQDEKITLRIVGPLDNPELSFESSSGYSQSDILELLTWGKRFEDQEISSSGFGNQAQAILGSWLEGQIEKNIAELGSAGMLGLLDNVSITGTSSLIDPTNRNELSIKAGVTDNLSFAYRRSFSLNAVGVELKVNRYFSLVGDIDEAGNFKVKYRLRYSY
ncbi:MAG: translocation/assembly module TamB domain-containing protein [Fidelibacterota bacterium]